MARKKKKNWSEKTCDFLGDLDSVIKSCNQVLYSLVETGKALGKLVKSIATGFIRK